MGRQRKLFLPENVLVALTFNQKIKFGPSLPKGTSTKTLAKLIAFLQLRWRQFAFALITVTINTWVFFDYCTDVKAAT